jgi:hypothetical protein
MNRVLDHHHRPVELRFAVIVSLLFIPIIFITTTNALSSTGPPPCPENTKRSLLIRGHMQAKPFSAVIVECRNHGVLESHGAIDLTQFQSHPIQVRKASAVPLSHPHIFAVQYLH